MPLRRKIVVLYGSASFRASATAVSSDLIGLLNEPVPSNGTFGSTYRQCVVVQTSLSLSLSLSSSSSDLAVFALSRVNQERRGLSGKGNLAKSIEFKSVVDLFPQGIIAGSPRLHALCKLESQNPHLTIQLGFVQMP